MAKAATGALIACLAVVGFCAGGQPTTSTVPASQPSAKIAIFRIIAPHKYGTTPSAIPTESLKLSDKPLLTEEDIVFYDEAKGDLWISMGTVEKGDPDVMKFYHSPIGCPVVVVVNGKKQFAMELLILGTGLDAPRTYDHFGIASWHLVDTSSSQETHRDDVEFLAALKATGKLDETALKPRMTPQQAQSAARAMDLYAWNDSSYPSKPITTEPVPESWKVKSITFCRDASLLAPSMNIFGYSFLPMLHYVWLVQFETSGDVSRNNRLYIHWCAVDDRSGQALPILLPRFVKPFHLAGTNELSIGPLASVNDVREIAAKHLSEIASVKFLEYVEAPYPHELVWMCEGKDSTGKPARILVSDAWTEWRGPRFAGDVSRVELRKVVEAKTPPSYKPISTSKPSVEKSFPPGHSSQGLLGFPTSLLQCLR